MSETTTSVFDLPGIGPVVSWFYQTASGLDCAGAHEAGDFEGWYQDVSANPTRDAASLALREAYHRLGRNPDMQEEVVKLLRGIGLLPWECDRCDGCGWYEGGKTLRTHCEVCSGTGIVTREAQRDGVRDSVTADAGTDPLQTAPTTPERRPNKGGEE